MRDDLWGNEEVSKIKAKIKLMCEETKAGLISVVPTDIISISGMQAKIKLLQELLIEIDTIEREKNTDD